jgi:hypothetical protein
MAKLSRPRSGGAATVSRRSLWLLCEPGMTSPSQGSFPHNFIIAGSKMRYTYKIEYKERPVTVSFESPPLDVQTIIKAMRVELAAMGTDENFDYFNLTMKCEMGSRQHRGF